MSQEQLKDFLAMVAENPALQDKLKAAAGADAIVAVAQEAGFIFSAEDLQVAQKDLSDEQLGNVAGGMVTLSDYPFQIY